MAQARIGDTVRVHYEGRLADGTVFASSIDRDPAKLTIGARSVIPAFEEAVMGMEPDESKTIRIRVEQPLEQLREGLAPTIRQDRYRRFIQAVIPKEHHQKVFRDNAERLFSVSVDASLIRD